MAISIEKAQCKQAVTVKRISQDISKTFNTQNR
jgi:hypothetical protein